MNNTRTPLYKVGQIKKHFPVLGGILRRTKGYVKALDGVDLEVFRGETIAVIGESGCGKTTLGRMLALLDKPTGGELSFDFGQGLQDVSRKKKNTTQNPIFPPTHPPTSHNIFNP